MITLNNWFQKNTTRPIALAAIFVTLVWCVLCYGLLNEVSYQQNEGTRQLANLVSLSFSQKNRVLTESLLESSHATLGAESAAICQGGKALITSNADNNDCIGAGSLFHRKLVYAIPGSENFNVVMRFSKFGDRAAIWWLFFISIAFTGGCFVLLYKIKRRFFEDIFRPFQDGIFSEKPMPIKEFEEIRLKRKVLEESKEREAVLLAVLANKRKVTHNIKSPLRTLQEIQKSITAVVSAKDSKLLAGVVESINNFLWEQQPVLEKSGMPMAALMGQQAQEPVLISDFLEETLAQKSAEYQRLKAISLSLDQSGIPFGAFVSVVRHEFGSILSNIINNSVEAIGAERGKVSIEAIVIGGFLHIRVKDTGCGVPEEKKEIIFENDVSSKGGTGYGLYHARQYVNRWNGKIECMPVSRGACFEISLPIVRSPIWFANQMDILSKRNVIIFDDDPLIHQIWSDRLQSLIDEKKTKLYFASNEQEFENIFTLIESEISESAILCDFDLGLKNGKSGLDIIRSYGLETLTTIVTNSFQSDGLLHECLKQHIRILPKPCIHNVPIVA